MEKFEVHILGCGSAMPTTRHLPTSQVVNIREKLFMIDCGEGAQVQFRKARLKFSRLNHIFISHLHGDHCFGLPGLLSTLGLAGRTSELFIYSPGGLAESLTPLLEIFAHELPYKLTFKVFQTDYSSLLYEDRSFTVRTIPLEHRIPCCGFLFEEKPLLNHLRREMIDFYKIPVEWLNRIKHGEDYLVPGQPIIPNSILTTPATLPRKYAYCSDTAYTEKILPLIHGVDLLYHEATFAETERPEALKRFHSTAAQAAEIADKAKVKKLLLGHYSARYPDEFDLEREAKAVFPSTIVSREGMTIPL